MTRARKQFLGAEALPRFRAPVCGCGTRDLAEAWLAVGPVFSLSSRPESQGSRVRDLAVTVEAIMTRTAATAMAMSQRTQSMPGLPSPPNAV